MCVCVREREREREKERERERDRVCVCVTSISVRLKTRNFHGMIMLTSDLFVGRGQRRGIREGKGGERAEEGD